MSATKEAKTAQDPVMQPFVDFWASCLEDYNQQTKSMLDGMRLSRDPQTWKRRWLDALSASCDAYLRSPAFLDMMRKNSDLSSKAKTQINQVTKQAAKAMGIPHASDVGALIEQVRETEGHILERLGKLECRLEALENKLKS
ncbi:MAG: hypothetical protein U1D30_04825 [Planctomycetota bacterium]